MNPSRFGRVGIAFWLVLSLGSASQGCSRRSDQPEAAAVASAPKLDWPTLKVLSYRLDLESKSATTLQGVPFALEVKAGVDLIPLERQGERVALLLRLRGTKVSFAGKPSSEGDALAKELEGPFWFALERGRLVESRISEGLSGQAVSLLRTLSSSLQLTAPAGAQYSGKPWAVKEHDATGEYEARYEPGEGGSVRRLKQRYLDALITGKVTAQQRQTMLPQVVRAEAKLRLAAGVVQGVESTEEVRSTLLGKDSVSVITRLSLTRDGAEMRDPEPAMLALSGDLVALLPSRAYGVSDARAAFDALRAEDAKFSDVLASLEAIARDPERRALVGAINDKGVSDLAQDQAKNQLQERATQLGKLSALLRTRPETVRELEAAVLKGSPAASMLLDSLAAAGTVDAQAALITLLQGAQLPSALRSHGATSLIRVQLASPATLEFLTGLAGDPSLRDHAVYGLGTAARRLNENGEAARSEPIVDRLVAGLGQAKSANDRVRWLRGIANSASAKALPAVLPFVDDQNRLLRQAALEALRLMPDPRVDDILAERLRKEPLAVARETALRAATMRDPSPTLEQALLRTAKDDTDHAVRASARRLLERWATKRPSAQALLASLPVDKP